MPDFSTKTVDGLLRHQVWANDQGTCAFRQSFQHNLHQLQVLIEIIVCDRAKLCEIQPNDSSSKVWKLRHIGDELKKKERRESFAVKAIPSNPKVLTAISAGKVITRGVYRYTATSAGKVIIWGITGVLLQAPNARKVNTPSSAGKTITWGHLGMAIFTLHSSKKNEALKNDFWQNCVPRQSHAPALRSAHHSDEHCGTCTWRWRQPQCCSGILCA